ncbi:MAG: PDZ domain-containing protein, partial [Myxococcaceae bacterium]
RFAWRFGQGQPVLGRFRLQSLQPILRPADLHPLEVLRQLTQPKSPAELGGLQRGDEIVPIDAGPVASYQEGAARLKGPPGSEVAVTIRRNGTERTIKRTRWK